MHRQRLELSMTRGAFSALFYCSQKYMGTHRGFSTVRTAWLHYGQSHVPINLFTYLEAKSMPWSMFLVWCLIRVLAVLASSLLPYAEMFLCIWMVKGEPLSVDFTFNLLKRIPSRIRARIQLKPFDLPCFLSYPQTWRWFWEKKRNILFLNICFYFEGCVYGCSFISLSHCPGWISPAPSNRIILTKHYHCS